MALLFSCLGFSSSAQNVIVNGTPPFCNQVNLTLEATGLPCSGGDPAHWTLHNEAGGADISANSQPGSPCELGWTFGPGCWTVTVSVSAGGGAGYVFTELFCVEQPVAAFTISETNICENGCVEITDASTSPGSPIDTWTWGGLPCAAATVGDPAFTCCLPAGIYSPQLTVFANGCPATETNGGTIVASDNYPVAAITPASVLDCPGPMDLVLSNSTAGGPFTSAWAITDGGGVQVCGGTGNTITCPGLPNGNYQACLEVTNAGGCSSDTCITATFFDEPQLSIAVNPATTCANTCVSLTANAMPTAPQTVTWSVLDPSGNPTSQQPAAGASVACFMFPAAGTYTVQATATYSATCSAMAELTVDVHEPLVADFSPGEDTTFCAPFSINFINQSAGTGTLGYQWTLNGAVQSTAADAALAFAANGTVTLEVTNELGCTAADSIQVTVDQPELNITVQTGACAGVDICPHHALNLAPASEEVAAWAWDFGDGFTATDSVTCHSYATEGTYTICLTITTANGCTASDCSDIVISPPLSADFGPVPQVRCAGDGVFFQAVNTNGTTYAWSYAGDSCSFFVLPGYIPSYSVLPNCTGCFDVTLTINNEGCAASQTIDDAVCFYGPVVKFDYTQSCTTPYVADFNAYFLTYDVATLEWDFNNDGIPDLSGPASDTAYSSPSWDYSAWGEGEYVVSVTAYPANYPDTCSYTHLERIYIDVPSARLSFTPVTGCPPLCVAFVPDDEPYAVAWNADFGNGDTLFAQATPIASPWDDPYIGSYTNWTGAYGTTAAPGNPINTAFADGPFPQPPYWNSPCIAYDQAGVYSVTATSTNINGCMATATYVDTISISTAPVFSTYTYAFTNLCGPFCMEVEADNPLDSYTWRYRTDASGAWTAFGTGQNQEELCLPAVPGYLEVRLDGTLGSCSDNRFSVVLVPVPAQAEATFSDVTPCRNQQVTFTALGTGVTGHAWTVTDPAGTVTTGTGTSFSPVPSPFSTAGAYQACLSVVDDTYACTDTTCQTIEVFMPSTAVDLTVTPSGCFSQVTVCPDAPVPGPSYNYALIRTYPLPVEVTALPLNPVTQCATSGFLPYGVYNVTVTAYGPGAWSDCTETDTIQDILDMGNVLGPWTWTPLDSVNCTPYCVRFVVFDTMETSYQYVWNPGDGSPTITGAVVEHCYTQPGYYLPNLQVVFPNGCGPFFYGDTIWVIPFEVSASSIGPICEGECASVQFTADDPALGIHSMSFIPNTAVAPVLPQPPWAYELCPAATTQYRAVAQYAQCVDTVGVEVTVHPLPVITAEPYGPFCINAGALPCPVVTPAPNTGSAHWWSPFSCPADPLILLSGDTSIVYHYADAFGCIDSLDIPFTILDTAAVAFLDSMHVCVGDDPLNLQPFVELPGDSFQVAYNPPFWTDEPSGYFHPAWVASMPCPVVEVPVRYNYTNAVGCTSRNDSVIFIHPLPGTQFTANDVCAYDPLLVTNTSTMACDAITAWQWSITGNGGPVTEQVGPFQYAPGPVAISLTATSSYGCTATHNDTAIVHPVPVAAFSVPDTCQYDAVPYTDGSTIAWNTGVDVINARAWRFGDGTTSSDQHPAHAWQMWGDFADTLIVTSGFGCADTVISTITVHPAPVNSMVFAPNCFGESTPIASTSTIPQGSIDSTWWDLEAAPSFGYSGTSITHVFSSSPPFFHPITLYTRSDQGCTAVIDTTIEVWPLPAVDYNISQEELCAEGFVVFSDASSIPPPYHNTAWTWLINGEPWGTGQTTDLAFPDSGSFDVALVVTTANGCSDTLANAAQVLVHPLPIAGFSANPAHTDLYRPEVQFTDSSLGAVHWAYHFGEGGFSHLRDPLYRYANFGTYTVQQVVANEFDCTDTAYAQIIIDPEIIIYVPNSFTPDGDGVNDFFMPSLAGFGVKSYEFTIWDRWGECIFSTTDATKAWDGRLDDELVKNDVYVWQLKVAAVEFAAPQHLRGHVTVLR